MKQWIYECLGVLIKEPTEEVRKIVAETISSELGEKIADLEKQIESNQKYIADLEKSNNAGSVYISNLEEQLEWAKEFLEKFCSYYMYDCDATRKDYDTFEELKKQAEQFLKEVTK